MIRSAKLFRIVVLMLAVVAVSGSSAPRAEAFVYAERLFTYYSDYFVTQVGWSNHYCTGVYFIDGNRSTNYRMLDQTICTTGANNVWCSEKVNGVWEVIPCP
jgi:hypothetical protein